MKKENDKKSTNDLENYLNPSNSTINKESLVFNSWSQNVLQQYYHKDIHLKSTLFILVQNGNGIIEINRKKHSIKSQDIILVSFGHFLKIIELSSDFSSKSLYVSTDYADQMYSTDMLYQRVKYSVMMYKNPILNLDKMASKTLLKRIDFIEEISKNESHFFKKEMILNALRIFFLDLQNYIATEEVNNDDILPSRDEIYFQKFLELLAKYYKKEHLVNFYAGEIHITPHYLTLIVKRLSGQTVSDFVNQLLYSEAKLLLQQPNYSVQQIAEELHFSDQSAFGKFFKRKSGLSPKQYQNIKL